MSDEGTGFGLPRESRIARSAEIRLLFQRGKRRKTRHLDAFVSPSPAPFPRLGVVVPKHKHTIVERNKVRRRLRELGRTVLLPALRNSGAALDVMVRARPEAYTAPFEQLRDEIAHLAEELCSRAR
ncbi:MAG TPA: ribonuclease P protein component [Longimicrobium sp.]